MLVRRLLYMHCVSAAQALYLLHRHCVSDAQALLAAQALRFCCSGIWNVSDNDFG